MARAKNSIQSLGLPTDLTPDSHPKMEVMTHSMGKVPLPLGMEIDASFFIDPEMRPGNVTSIFGRPEQYLKDVNPECKYVWKNAYAGKGIDPKLMSGIRNRKYRPITVEEIREDADFDVSTITLFKHSGAGDVTGVVLRDLCLVEVSPRAVKEDYKWRESVAAARTVRGVGQQAFSEQAAKQGIRMDPELLRFEEGITDKG